MGCSLWGRWESDTTERLHFHFSLSRFGEGNGNPLQCSCLENPRDGGAWWAAVYGVAQIRTRLKWLSSSSSSITLSLILLIDMSLFFWSLSFKIYILSFYYCLAGSVSAGLKDQCSAMKKKCHYSEYTVILNWMMTLSEAVWKSLVEEIFFLFLKRSLGLKKKRLKNTVLKSADLGSIFLFASDSVCALCQIPAFS